MSAILVFRIVQYVLCVCMKHAELHVCEAEIR
jgi:hypothetical protein